MKLKDITEASPGRRSRGRARQADARMKSFAKRWMADVSDEVEKLNPKMAGRIDWDTDRLQQLISLDTRKMLLDYNQIRGAFEIKIKKVELTDILDGDWKDIIIKKGVVSTIP